MSEWKKVTIGDLCARVSSGGTPKSTISAYYDNGIIPWLNSKEVHFCNIYSTEKKITERGLAESSAKWIDKDSVIVAMYGATAGQVAITKIPLTTNQACCNLTIDKDIADYRYVYYWLFYRYDVLSALANGGAQQNLNAKIIKAFEINLPPLSIQKQISDILSSLDSKIELNTQINQNLEAQAQAIFKSWFVDFEPFRNGKFVASALGPIPEGWRIVPLDEIATFLNGLPMQKYRPFADEIGLPVLKIKELREQCCSPDSERCTEHISPEYIVDDGDVIFSWSGSLMVDIWTGGRCGLNQHLFKVTSAQYEKWFHYLWTQYHMREFIAIAADKATTMGHIQRGHLHTALTLVPPKQEYSKLSAILTPIIERLIQSKIESRHLATIRDTLLPKLMSGEIDVSEVEV